MGNHFGKGLMAGLQASYADTAAHAANFCADYKRGFVLATRTACLKKPATASSAPGKRGSSPVAMAWTGIW